MTLDKQTGQRGHEDSWRRQDASLAIIPDFTLTMFLYAMLSVLSAYNARGAPVRFDLTRDEPWNPESCRSQSQRTLFGIILSCMSTTILCAWTAVHPNVPPRSKWKARWNRLTLMFWMIVAPELVLAWAVRQIFAAKYIRDTYNERKGVFSTFLRNGRRMINDL